MITVTVTRSGGITGMTRTWTLTVDSETWDELASSPTPAGEPADESAGRDRYRYRIEAASVTVELPESALGDDWRKLLRPPSRRSVS